MRRHILEFVRIAAETLPMPDPVYEFGSLQVPGQEGWADLRPLFPGKQYVGADFRAGPGVDVVLDLHAIGLPDASVGTLLMLETMEHVERPWQAVAEAHRVLGPGGILLMTSQMNFPIHAFPNDYWRYTPEAFRSLLKDFATVYVQWAGEADFPHTVVGLACKGELPADALAVIDRRARVWRSRWRFPSGQSWRRFVKPLLPPVVLDAAMKVEAALRRGTRRA